MFVSGSIHTNGQSVSPSFDKIRGLSTEIGSYNNLSSFLPSDHETPRRKILENFKEINRMLRSNFLENKHNRKGLSKEELALRETGDEAVNDMARHMKVMFNHQMF